MFQFSDKRIKTVIRGSLRQRMYTAAYMPINRKIQISTPHIYLVVCRESLKKTAPLDDEDELTHFAIASSYEQPRFRVFHHLVGDIHISCTENSKLFS